MREAFGALTLVPRDLSEKCLGFGRAGPVSSREQGVTCLLERVDPPIVRGYEQSLRPTKEQIRTVGVVSGHSVSASA